MQIMEEFDRILKKMITKMRETWMEMIPKVFEVSKMNPIQD